MQLLVEGIFRCYGFDFRQYSPGSLKRRIWYSASEQGAATISGLQEKVLHDPSCMERLQAGGKGSFAEYYTARRDHAILHADLRRNASEAQYRAMPEAAIATARVDRILPLAEIARLLGGLCRTRTE